MNVYQFPCNTWMLIHYWWLFIWYKKYKTRKFPNFMHNFMLERLKAIFLRNCQWEIKTFKEMEYIIISHKEQMRKKCCFLEFSDEFHMKKQMIIWYQKYWWPIICVKSLDLFHITFLSIHKVLSNLFLDISLLLDTFPCYILVLC